MSHEALIRRYYDACNSADVAALEACFTEDVVHWFLAPNLAPAPVHGREALAKYWHRVQPRIDGRWVVDHCLETAGEAVIEWTLFWTPAPGADRVATRGAEWYVFRDGLISEIRAYYNQGPWTSELDGFPYADRGYSLTTDEGRTLRR